MRFGILGSLEVRDGSGRPVVLSGTKRRTLLMRLLVDAGRAVPAERLAEDLWDEEPPPGFHATLQSHVSHVRRVVGDRVRNVGGCYRLELVDDEVDARVFEAQALRGRTLARDGDARLAVEVLDAALGLWRGPALADVATRAWALPEVARLEELRLQALEAGIEARLDIGEPAEAAARAEAAVAEHPFRERLSGLLITALYLDGRQADALRSYERLRRRLADELGIDPSPELRAIERAVLTQEPGFGRRAPAVPHEDLLGPAPAASGTLTFLFTDIEGSTALWESSPAGMQEALATHDEIVCGAIRRGGGTVFATGGDGFAAAFPSARSAVDAALEAQRALQAMPADDGVQIRVRMALHSGEAVERRGNFFGPPVNRTARLAALAHGGQVLCTAATAELLAGAVELVDLGSFRLKDVPGLQRVFQAGGGDFGPTGAPDRPTTAAARPADLVGRDADVRDVMSLLSGARLVTLTGPGGVGKTRLALAVAAQMEQTLPDGCWLVELAKATGPDDVPRVAAASLGLPGTDPGTLGRYVGDRRLLLVLDNCEHVIENVADLVDEILGLGAEPLILATSREPLGVPSEVVRAVRPLAVPAENVTLGEALTNDAVRLFARRASARGGFALDEGNVAAVSEICRRLDGLPLAIELAAAQASAMSLADLSHRLDQRFRLLAASGRRGEERHRTLQAAVTWSYERLSEPQRAVFRRMSVFPSSFDLAGAEAVAAGPDLDVAACVVALVRCSMVGYDATVGRYALLETLREYGADQLAAAGEVDATWSRHAAHYQAVAEALADGSEAAQDWLTAELDNLRVAIGWLVGARRWSAVFSTLHRTWRHWLELAAADFFDSYASALLHCPALPRRDRAEALGRLAFVAHWCRGPDVVRDLAEQARALATDEGLSGCGFWGEAAIAVSSSACGDSVEAAQASQRAVTIAEAAGMAAEAAFAMALRGSALRELHREDEARRAADEAVARARVAGEPILLRSTLLTAVSVTMWPGRSPDVPRARPLLDELHALGHLAPIQQCWTDIYSAVAALGDAGCEALGHLQDAIAVADVHNLRAATHTAARLLAIAAARRERLDLAAQLVGFVAGHLGDLPSAAIYDAWIDDELARLLAPLPPAVRDEHHVAGMSLSRRRFLHLVHAVTASEG